MMNVCLLQLLIACAVLAQGCGGDETFRSESDGTQGLSCSLTPSELPFAFEVLSFSPGLNAGYGEAEYPDVVLGPPKGAGSESGSLHVLSLGVGGEIILSFGDRKVVDGDGFDFVVFENPFAIGGDVTNPFAELAEVSVSMDGETWTAFGCDPESNYPHTGCAGWQLLERFDGCVTHLDAAVTGGDAFDLADLGLSEARYIRLVDLSTSGTAPSAGFDLDALGAFHLFNATSLSF